MSRKSIFYRVLLVLILIGISFGAPSVYLTEEVTHTYLEDGSVSTTGIGYIEVDVKNPSDVLQNILVNLTDTNNTNLLGRRAYRSAAASPLGGKTRIFVNTTDGPTSLSYTINGSALQGVEINFTYGNYIGGTDLVPGMNTLWFQIILTAHGDPGNVFMNFTVPINGDMLVSSMNVSQPGSDIASEYGRSDLNLDGYYDYIHWTGFMQDEDTATIVFDGVVITDVNFEEDNKYVEIGDIRTYFEEDGITLTGIGIEDKAAKGPVQEGIELLIDGLGGTRVRGFLRNIASGLIYKVNFWALYWVNNDTALIADNVSETINPGVLYSTDWKTTETPEKLYYRTAFDWEVFWGETFHTGKGLSFYGVPDLYEIEFVWTKDLVTEVIGGKHDVKITDEIIDVGHSSLGVESIYWNMTLPCTGSGSSTEWEVDSAVLYYTNNTNTSIWGEVGFATNTQDCLAGVGFVKYETENITLLLGHPLGYNDYLILEANISGTQPQTDGTYLFNSTFLGITISGTPYTIKLNKSALLPGVVEPPQEEGGREAAGGGGFVGVLPAEEQIIDLIMDVSLEDTVATVYFSAEAMNIKKSISETIIEILVPTKATLQDKKVDILVRGKKTLVEPDYVVRKVGDDNYHVYKYGVWSLKEGDKIEFEYPVSLGTGDNELIVNFRGRNVDTGDYFSVSISKIIRIALPPTALGFDIWEEDFQIIEAKVNSPVGWEKSLLIYNNQSRREGVFEVEVFPDTLDYQIVTADNREVDATILKIGEKTYLQWKDLIYKLETRKYFVTVYTPPVMGMIKTIDVLNTTREITYFELSFGLESLAEEDYYNLSYHLPLEVGIVDQVNIEGTRMEFKYEPFRINIPYYEAKAVKDGSLIYKERPPQLIVLSDRDEYSLDSTINVTAVIITKDPIKSAYAEFEVIGPAPDYDTVFYDSVALGDLDEASITRVPYPVSLSTIPGTHTIRVKLRKNLWTILDGRKEIDMVGIGVAREFFVIVLLLVILVTLGFSVHRIRKLSKMKLKVPGASMDRCVICGGDFKGKRKYTCERCHKHVCFEHVKFYKGHLYCQKCSGIEKVEKPRGS